MASIQKTGPAVELTDYVHDGEKAFENVDSNIPVRYRGTEADKRDMSVLGHKQVLRVSKSNDLRQDPKLTVTAQFQIRYHVRFCLNRHGELGDYPSVRVLVSKGCNYS